MQVICLQNLIHKGRSYKAGAYIELDEEHAHALQFMDLVHIPESEATQATESGEEDSTEENPEPAKEKAPKKARKAADK